MRHLTLIVPLLATLAAPACTTTSPSDPTARADEDGAEPAIASTGTPDLCGTLAAQLTTLLAAAQSCNVAAANPTQCASWVPSLDGCQQPVASMGSDATKQYLEVFEQYAQSCPLPDHPCIDPIGLAVDCTQSADTDSLVGRCAIRATP